MTSAQRVAKVFKKQYYDGRKKQWKTYDCWQIQPEAIHTVLLELKTKNAVDLLMGNSSWTKNRWNRKAKK